MMKGIAIILVIVGHWSVPEIVGRFIYAWHMPLFFMLSGFFFKVISFSKSFKKCVRSIVVPYMLSCAVIIILSLIDDTVNSKSIIWGALTGCPRALFESNVFFAKGYIHALWFLPALFICRIIYCLTPQINDWLKSLILGGGSLFRNEGSFKIRAYAIWYSSRIVRNVILSSRVYGE